MLIRTTKNVIKTGLARFDRALVSKKRFDKLVSQRHELEAVRRELGSNRDDSRDLQFVKAIDPKYRSKCIDYLSVSHAKLRQDLFALVEHDFKRNGFFVEFGAANGIDASNTFLLEREFGWTGILSEPAKVWHEALRKNRAARIDTRCVWSHSGETLTFNQPDVGRLSTIDEFSSGDSFKEKRKKGMKYDVDTVSLVDLLIEHGAPQDIDFMSIDTEGSEFDILKTFDFDRFNIAVIVCEHNFTERRNDLFELFMENGYERKFQSLSGCDDWYVKK